MSGYLKAERDRFGHYLFRSEKFCRGYAWDWMCANARFAPTEYDVKGRKIIVQRGQFVASPDEMAAAWNWSRSAVNRFLARLKTEHMIEHETGQGKSLITICNYEKFQSREDEAGQSTGQSTGHKPDTNRTPKKECKEGEKDSEQKILTLHSPDPQPSTPDPVAEGFKEFWADIWPKHFRKVGKSNCQATYSAACKGTLKNAEKIDPVTLNRAARLFVASVSDPQYLPEPARWIRKPGWEPFLESAQRDQITPDQQRYRDIIAGSRR